MKQNFLIIGSSGFIGSSICNNDQFKRKYNIIGYNSKNLNLLKKNFSKSFKKNLTGSTVIFTAGKHRLYGDTVRDKKKNIMILKNFCSNLKKYKPERIVFLSTVEVYGSKKRNRKISEKSKTAFLNNYSCGKLCQEKILKKVCFENSIDYVILRLPGVFGKKDKNFSIVSKIYNSQKNKKFILYGRGEELRDYLYINDFIIFLFKLLQIKKIPKLINVISGKSFSINKIVKILLKNSKKSIEFEFQKNFSNIKKFDLVFNNRKIKKIKLSKYIRPFNQCVDDYLKFNY